MDHFNISQTCVKCLRGKEVFKVDLNLYDAEGKLISQNRTNKKFSFTCEYCLFESWLDFDKFSHPDLILHLKSLNEQYNQLEDMLNKFEIVLNQLLVVVNEM